MPRGTHGNQAKGADHYRWNGGQKDLSAAKAARARYRASPKGKAVVARWLAGPAGKAMQARKNASLKGKARQVRYNASEKGRAHTAAYRRSPEARAIRALWLATPKAQARKHEAQRIRRYGLDDSGYFSMVERQRRRCANQACLQPLIINSRQCHVDHCHQTGAVRGLLCCQCNHALGVLETNRARIVGLEEYLHSHSGASVRGK